MKTRKGYAVRITHEDSDLVVFADDEQTLIEGMRKFITHACNFPEAEVRAKICTGQMMLPSPDQKDYKEFINTITKE
jgi:hypothetical protein